MPILLFANDSCSYTCVRWLHVGSVDIKKPSGEARAKGQVFHCPCCWYLPLAAGWKFVAAKVIYRIAFAVWFSQTTAVRFFGMAQFARPHHPNDLPAWPYGYSPRFGRCGRDKCNHHCGIIISSNDSTMLPSESSPHTQILRPSVSAKRISDAWYFTIRPLLHGITISPQAVNHVPLNGPSMQSRFSSVISKHNRPSKPNEHRRYNQRRVIPLPLRIVKLSRNHAANVLPAV